VIIVREGIEGKVCSKCRVWKPLGEFYSDPSHPPSQGGRHCQCRDCHRPSPIVKQVAKMIRQGLSHAEIMAAIRNQNS